MSYLWVTVGSALGGLLRFTIGRLMLSFDVSIGFPIGTVLINVIGSFVIGYFGTLTLHSGRYPASDNVRLFVMVGDLRRIHDLLLLQPPDLRSDPFRRMGQGPGKCRSVGGVVPGCGRRWPSPGAALGSRHRHRRNRRRRIYRLILPSLSINLCCARQLLRRPAFNRIFGALLAAIRYVRLSYL